MLIFTLILCILNVSLIHSISFMEYALYLTRGNRIIHATLTEKESGQVWTIEERIASGDRIEGRIDVTSSKLEEPVNVFYSFKPGYDNGRRLVMQKRDCDLYIYKSDWAKQFPGVTKSLTNTILLLGPSIFLRLTDEKWVAGKDEVIRGALMHSASLIISRKLKITLYYKGEFNLEIGVFQPSRIVMTGYDPKAQVDQEIGETLVLDIFLQSITYESLSESVQPFPGIGCPSYLQDNIKLPALTSDRIHYLVKEIPNQGTAILKEVHADAYHNVLRLSETRYGATTDFLYDYNLGIEYLLSKYCSVNGAALYSPGIDGTSRKFSLSSLLWIEGSFQYLGQVIFEHRSGFITKVWESVQFDITIGRDKYDKVVTTVYLAPSPKESIFGGYIFVASTRKAYKKHDSGGFKLFESVHRDYYDFEIDEPEAEYENAFRLGSCTPASKQRLTLTMHVTCDILKKPNCLKIAENSTNILRMNLIDMIEQTYSLSPLRIVDVELIFTKERIEVDVTFVETPNIETFLKTDLEMSIDLKAVKQLYPKTSTKSEQECLKFQSSYFNSGSAVIYCKDGNQCMSTEHLDSIKSNEPNSGGTTCSIYYTPLRNLYRLSREKSLQEIHDHILKELSHETFNLDISGDKFTYEISDVVAKNRRAEEKEKEIFHLFNSGVRLMPNDFDIVEVPNIKRFSDCYRACAKSEEIFCETFSFCEDKDTTKCIVSTHTEKQIKNNLTSTDGCMTYAKNHLSDYFQHSDRSFKAPTSVSQDLWIDDCATECAFSPDCFSFEYCHGRCTFGGYYTESSTKFSFGCQVYSPKLSRKYEMTGSKIVTEVIHTELDLDLDQCALLCLDYHQDDGEVCQSFNYCPKSGKPASCQLTKYSVSDSKTATTQSDICHNFEISIKTGLKGFEQGDDPIANKQPVRTTGSGAFGIIMLFLFIGLFVGFVGPYSVMKLKSSLTRGRSNDFNWSKHVDTGEEEQNEIQI